MKKHPICLALSKQFGISYEEQLELFRKIGFDGAFVGYNENNIDAVASKIKENGLIFQSVHAPFIRMADIWNKDKEKVDIALNELNSCLNACARNSVPIMVMHAFIGFEDHCPTQVGIDRLGTLIQHAEKLGVKIAFENTEGVEYLDAVMDAFTSNDNVGFCWDTGHEMCYNRSDNMIAKYGDKLLCTHLNDNLGITSPDGRITWLDDLHLLPFDGIADWENIALRLQSVNYSGELTFELNTVSKPGRHENDKYAAMDIESYLKEVYTRACRIEAMLR